MLLRYVSILKCVTDKRIVLDDHQQSRQVHIEYQVEVKSILTPEQYQERIRFQTSHPSSSEGTRSMFLLFQ